MKDIKDSFHSKELFEQKEQQRQEEIRRRAWKADHDKTQTKISNVRYEHHLSTGGQSLH